VDKVEEPAKPAAAVPGTPEMPDTPEIKAAFEKFKSCAVDVLQVPEDKVVPKARFEDLDADSLDLVELVMALEEAFEITVEETELEGVETIGQAFALVTSKI
jgi:acyl carrier protein